MNNLRRLFFHLFVWFASSSIVVTSVVFVLPNSQLHKKRLVDNNFYEKINTQIKPEISLEQAALKSSFSYILSNTIIREIVTPMFLRGVIEKNIDITSSWLNGKDNWELYVPTREVEQALLKSVDKETDNFVTANKKELKVCTQTQSDTIKVEGFDLNKDFCIPSEVRNNQKTLTEFISNSSLQPSIGILNDLVKGSNLSNKSEIQNINEIAANSSQSKQKIISFITSARDLSIALRNNVISLALIIIGLILTNVMFLYATRRNPLFFVFRACFSVALFTSIFSGIFVFAVGGTSYIISAIKEFLLPGFVNSEVIKIISEQLVIFALDLVFPALITALGFLLVGLLFWILNRLNIFVPKKFKERIPKTSNQSYKKLFRVPEESILGNNHKNKPDLLKKNEHNLQNKKLLRLPSPRLNLPGTFGYIKRLTTARINKNKETKILPNNHFIIPNKLNTATTHKKSTEESQTVRKIQL